MPTGSEIVARRKIDAARFLEIGKDEWLRGLAASDEYRVRQGIEKVFHALSNAYVLLILRYRQFQSYPTTHDALVADLLTAGLDLQARLFTEVKEIFHARIYYQGETNLYELAGRYLGQVEREVRASLEGSMR